MTLLLKNPKRVYFLVFVLIVIALFPEFDTYFLPLLFVILLIFYVKPVPKCRNRKTRTKMKASDMFWLQLGLQDELNFF